MATPRDTLSDVRLRTAALTLDGRTLAAANPDHSITLWDLAAGRATRTLIGHTGNVTALAFSSDGSALASGGEEGTIRVWSTASGSLIRAITRQASIAAIAVSPDGSMVASGDSGGVVHLWQTSDGQERQTLRGHTGAISTLVFNPAGQNLVSGGQDRDIRIWDTGSGKELGRLVGHGGEIESAAFSQDSKSLASGSADRTIKIWDMERNQVRETLTGHSGGIRAVAFNPGGNVLASGSDDRTVKLWDLSKGQAIHTLTGHNDAIPAVAFSGDGSAVISGGRDSSARQWDAVSGRQQRTIDLRPAPVATPTPLPTVTTGAGAGTIALNGRPTPFTVATPKQQVAWTFSGTAGQQVSAAVKATALTEADIVLVGPDGLWLNNRYVGGEGFLDTTTLPTTGTYTLLFTPRNNDTGSGTITAYTFADTTSTITPGGPAASFSLTTPGQNARWIFTATADQGISAVVQAPSLTDADIIVYDAAGRRIGSRYMSGEGFLDAVPLPGAGTYTLVVDPRETGLGNGMIMAYAVTDTTATITAGGPAQPFSIATPGQNARFTFAGTANQQVSAAITGSTVQGGDIVILNPDGTRLGSRFFANGGFLDTITLSQSGTYTLVIDPRETDTGAGNVILYSITDSSGTVTIDGPPVLVTLGTPGQRTTLTFSGRAGQQITIEVASTTLDGNDITIAAPDGTTILQRFVGNTGTVEATLPANGTYTLTFDPREELTGTATLTVRTTR